LSPIYAGLWMNETLFVAGGLAAAVAAALAWAALLWWGKERRDEAARLGEAVEGRVAALQSEIATLRQVSSPEVHERLSAALASSAGYVRHLESRIDHYERTLSEYRAVEDSKATAERDRIKESLREVAGRFEQLSSAVAALRRTDDRLEILQSADSVADKAAVATADDDRC